MTSLLHAKNFCSTFCCSCTTKSRRYKEIHSKLEAEAVESQTLASELEQALAAEKEARRAEANALKEMYAS